MKQNADKTQTGYFKDFLAVARRIPRGRVATYGDIAYAAGHPGMARQVAWALRASPEGVPWQRVVGAGGKILLTGEFGFEQRFRLESEGVKFKGQRVEMKRFQHSFQKESGSKRRAPAKKPAKVATKKTGS